MCFTDPDVTTGAAAGQERDVYYHGCGRAEHYSRSLDAKTTKAKMQTKKCEAAFISILVWTCPAEISATEKEMVNLEQKYLGTTKNIEISHRTLKA